MSFLFDSATGRQRPSGSAARNATGNLTVTIRRARAVASTASAVRRRHTGAPSSRRRRSCPTFSGRLPRRTLGQRRTLHPRRVTKPQQLPRPLCPPLPRRLAPSCVPERAQRGDRSASARPSATVIGIGTAGIRHTSTSDGARVPRRATALRERAASDTNRRVATNRRLRTCFILNCLVNPAST